MKAYYNFLNRNIQEHITVLQFCKNFINQFVNFFSCVVCCDLLQSFSHVLYWFNYVLFTVYSYSFYHVLSFVFITMSFVFMFLLNFSMVSALKVEMVGANLLCSEQKGLKR